MGCIHIATATTVFVLIFCYGSRSEAFDIGHKSIFKVKKDNLENKKARDIISSFLNAWKSSKIIPENGHSSEHDNNEILARKLAGKTNGFQLDGLSFLGQRRSRLDGPSLYALQNAFNPRPVKKAKSRPINPEAETFFGKEIDDNEDAAPEVKLASLVSKPIYHTIPGRLRQNTEEDIKQFMFGGNEGENENHFGLPNEDWQANLNTRRSFLKIPGVNSRHRGKAEYYTGNNEAKRNDIIRGARYETAHRNEEILPSVERRLIEQLEREHAYNQLGDKKELITDHYDALSLPVSEFLNGQQNDRKFYKSLPDNMIDEFETRQIPSQFKLQKNPLWGNIQKRWRRSKVNKKGNWPVQEEVTVRGVPRSLGIGLGETGNSYDAYGQIGQNIDQSLMKLNGDKPGCGQSPEIKIDPVTSHESMPAVFMNGADVQPEESRQADNGIIKISPSQRRSRIISYDQLANPILRNKRSLLLLKKRAIEDALAKKFKATKLQERKADGNAASRSLSRHYVGGLPDSRPMEADEGITEDSEHDNLDEKLSHDSTPLLMKIAQHDRDDMNKLWSNKHSPGNGFYAGHGEGPNRPYLGDYFGHGPEEMLHDDGIKSLEESASPEDHHTANIIDSIWEHDLGEDHLGEHRIERHHPGLKIKNYFGGHHPSVMLPTETLDGIDTHWTGHLPRAHSSEYSHNDGHPIDFPPTRIKAIQAIQDDPLIDAELNPHDGIGTPMGHGHHYSHGYHHGGEGHAYGGMNLNPVISDPVHVEDSHEEEYKQHIDNLLTQYHGLEEHLRGTDGTLAGHMDPAAFGHHGSHHLHTGYDLYAYKNPWEGMKLPYHVPVINHPMGQEEETPPSPLSFEGKTDEKGAPMVEGGKEEGGKGGPLVEEAKEMAPKGEKGKEGESPKGAKSSGSKSPLPVIPKQRGGPDVSTGKNGTDEQEKGGKGKESKEKEAGEIEGETKKENKEETKEEKSSSEEVEETKTHGKERKQKENKEVDDKEKEAKNEESKSDEKEEVEKDLKKMVEKMMNSTGKQSEMLNNLKEALGDEANNPKSVAALQLAKLKQLGTMQQALLSSLAKQTNKKQKESSQVGSEGAGMNEIKQLLELQSLQQLGAGLKANALVTSLRQNSLLHSLKSAQENILKSIKKNTGLIEENGGEKQDNEALTQSAEIQKFFGKIPVKLLGSDLGNVGSEKLTSRTQPLVTSNAENENNIGSFIHKLKTTHAKNPAKTGTEASGLKPMLNSLLSESLLRTMKNKLKHMSRNTVNKDGNENTLSDKAYSTIGNEGPTTAGDETGHRRSTKEKKKTKTKHKKGNEEEKKENEAGKKGEKKENEEKEVNSVEKAEIAPFHEKELDEDVVSKKDQVRHN